MYIKFWTILTLIYRNNGNFRYLYAEIMRHLVYQTKRSVDNKFKLLDLVNSTIVRFIDGVVIQNEKKIFSFKNKLCNSNNQINLDLN